MDHTTAHIAIQYLAATAISFLDKEPDDSHTNLGWSSTHQFVYTRPLNEFGYMLALDYTSLILRWINKNFKCYGSIPIEESTHIEIINWIKSKANTLGSNKRFQYKFHYSLPYPEISNDFEFPTTDWDALSTLTSNRITAKQVLKKVLNIYYSGNEIRIWPHHFDTAALFHINNQVSVGIGMAIPDNIMNEFYFYVQAWKNGNVIDTVSFNPLTSKGEWFSNHDFNGAVSPLSNHSKDEAFTFFKEAIFILTDTY